MASKDERVFDSGLTGGTDVPASEEDFSLEEILAEYGAGREQRLMEAVEQEARRETEPEPEADPFDDDPDATRVLNLHDLHFGRNYTKEQ
mgnify:CR=1 FL=1